MPISQRDVERFAALFDGYDLAYGSYLIRGKSENGKVIGKPQTHRGKATLEHYRLHLEGVGGGLGVIMLKSNDTVSFAAIDYDNKKMDHVKAELQIRGLDLPLVLCRSKSGGGHFYCFMKSETPAIDVRERLGEWTSLLGLAATTEQFPKQTTRFNEDDVGSWINLPYFAADATNRYAIVDGKQMTLREFLDYAESKLVTLSDMEHSALEDSALFDEGPPCLQTIEAQGGFQEGTKKDGMFNVGVYLRKRFPDDWEKRLDAYNGVMAQLRSDEVQGLVKQLGRKDYSFKCKQPPINACCNRRVCRTRQFGVGESGGEESKGYSIGNLIRYEAGEGDSPLYAMEINGKRILVTHEEFYNRDSFNKAAFAQINLIPVYMTPTRWLKTLNELILTASVVPLPVDASPTGQLWEHITMFLTQQVMATEREKVTLGVPYREGDRVYFRSMDLFGYLNARRIPFKSQQHVWDVLRRKGGDKIFWNLSGKGVNVWYLPAPSMGEEPDQDAKLEDGPKEAF